MSSPLLSVLLSHSAGEDEAPVLSGLRMLCLLTSTREAAIRGGPNLLPGWGERGRGPSPAVPLFCADGDVIVQDEGAGFHAVPVKVLNCDTISQVKEKIIDQVWPHTAFAPAGPRLTVWSSVSPFLGGLALCLEKLGRPGRGGGAGRPGRVGWAWVPGAGLCPPTEWRPDPQPRSARRT